MDIPLVLLESLYLERPIIVGDEPPLSEALLTDAGFAVPLGDVDALAGKIAALLADPDLRSRLGRQGHLAVAKRCQPATFAARYQSIYATALKLKCRASTRSPWLNRNGM
jgi:glycosyltransferase involved in cell wall biosynthesis